MNSSSKLTSMWRSSRTNKLIAVSVTMIVLTAGLVIILTKASGFFASNEPESGTVATNAHVITDGTASGGQAIQFNAPTPPPPSGGGGGTGTCAVSTQHVPDGPDGFGGCWPGAHNTGVPAGTVLTAYTGSCTITTPNTTIDAKTINCELEIQAANVTITRSKINGRIIVDTDTKVNNILIGLNWSLNLTDSEVAATAGDLPALYNGNMNVLRANIHGGHNAMECQEHSSHCSMKDSWVHDQWQSSTGETHLGGIAHFGEQVPCTGTGSGGMSGVCFDIEHSSIICDAVVNKDGGGCTGDINMIAHYGPIPGAYIYRNLLGANTGASFCSYGGQAPENGATRIVYQDNVFQRGTNRKCAAYGPINAFKFTNTGNVWGNNNRYDDGAIITCTAADECL